MGKEQVSIDAEEAERLRAAGVDVQAFVDREVRRAALRLEPPEARKARLQEWEARNRDAIEAYNREIDDRGVFGEDLRSW